MNYVVTFSGAAYDDTTALIAERVSSMGGAEILVFDDRWLIESGYHGVNRWLFETSSRIQDEPTEHKHGFGWCSWKAFVIQSAWDRMKDGDVVLYLDADTYPVAPFGMLFDACRVAGGIFLFEESGCSNLRFTKAECMLAMGLSVEDGNHACGRFSLWQKGPFFPRQVLTEWWAYSINPRCTLWSRSTICQDPPEYYRNSTEQSVLSNLARKYSIPLHRTPDQFGVPVTATSKDAAMYGQLFEQRDCRGDRQNLTGSRYRNCDLVAA